MTEPTTYRFGNVSVDLGRMAVEKDGQRIDLEPKAFDVLRLLIERRDRLVTKDELMNAVWGDAFVTPNVLTRAVAQLRKALDDDAHEARFIETVPTRGYRFIAPLTGETANPSHPVAAPPPTRTWKAAFVTAVIVLAIAVATVAWLRRPAATAANSFPTPAPSLVTIVAGNNAQPAISPDGSSIAFVSDRTGSLEIYVTGLARGSREFALTADGGQNMEPAWSPDGKWIAFHSRLHGGIWIVPSTGGSPVQIAERGSEPAWSPDSQSLVFSSSEGAMAGQATLAIVGRDGKSLHALTALGEPAGGHFSPAWSHNGTIIAFVVADGGGRSELWVVPAAAGAPRLLLAPGGAASPVFSPDDRLLYFGGFPPAQSGINSVAIDPISGSALGEPRKMMPFNLGGLNGLSIARTGLLAYGIARMESNLWAVDFGADGAAEAPHAVTTEIVRATKPAFSPDGRRLAFVQNGTGLESSTWVMNEDGSGRQPLLTDGLSGDPSWGPDATVFVHRGPKDDQSFVFVNVESGRVQPVPKLATPGIRNPRLSPDGRDLAYWTLEPNGAMNTWIQSLDGTKPIKITNDTEAINYPAWSPDGQWLAVEIKRGETTSIGVVPRRGGAVQQLTSEPGQSWPHSWSPDGERIVYAGQRDGVWNIYAVSRLTKKSVQLTHFTSPSGYVIYPSWSPRGNRIVFERASAEGSVWVLPAQPPN